MLLVSRSQTSGHTLKKRFHGRCLARPTAGQSRCSASVADLPRKCLYLSKNVKPWWHQHWVNGRFWYQTSVVLGRNSKHAYAKNFPSYQRLVVLRYCGASPTQKHLRKCLLQYPIPHNCCGVLWEMGRFIFAPSKETLS